jgi:hypothetical protein
MKLFSILEKDSILSLVHCWLHLLAERPRGNEQQVYVLLLGQRGLVCLQKRQKILNLTLLDLILATAADKLINGSKGWHSTP